VRKANLGGKDGVRCAEAMTAAAAGVGDATAATAVARRRAVAAGGPARGRTTGAANDAAGTALDWDGDASRRRVQAIGLIAPGVLCGDLASTKEPPEATRNAAEGGGEAGRLADA